MMSYIGAVKHLQEKKAKGVNMSCGNRVGKMVHVVERYIDEKGRKMERLSCGHTRRDPETYYGNEMSFCIKRLYQAMSPNEKIKARCYKCGAEGGDMLD